MAEVTGFEPVITISKTVALDQTKLYPNKKYGSTDWDRTNDQTINSRLHYRCATVEYLILVPGAQSPSELQWQRRIPPTHYSAFSLELNMLVTVPAWTYRIQRMSYGRSNRNGTDLRQVLAVLRGNDPLLQQ